MDDYNWDLAVAPAPPEPTKKSSKSKASTVNNTSKPAKSSWIPESISAASVPKKTPVALESQEAGEEVEVPVKKRRGRKGVDENGQKPDRVHYKKKQKHFVDSAAAALALADEVGHKAAEANQVKLAKMTKAQTEIRRREQLRQRRRAERQQRRNSRPPIRPASGPRPEPNNERPERHQIRPGAAKGKAQGPAKAKAKGGSAKAQRRVSFNLS